MKRNFGNFFERWTRGGTKLTDVEFDLLQHAVNSLPPSLRSIVESQFDSYNLVQREVDGRSLNFYRIKGGKVDREGLPLLEMSVEEAPLIRLTATVNGDSKPIHANLHAVTGHVFCMSLNRRAPAKGVVMVLKIKQSWRSNF
ncbi:MAG TPA: hypothetical protein PLP21_01265 [Pyrinomonadaceae bacterium]|nr:hypothetical protein [Acidobacteriota bacterium]HQZ94911.1 hypothetical protein [Pyrinomonadaceae bacterium]